MMLFVCDNCGSVDAVELAYPELKVPPLSLTELKCSGCQGKWHGQFEQKPYDPSQDLVINRATGIGLG